MIGAIGLLIEDAVAAGMSFDPSLFDAGRLKGKNSKLDSNIDDRNNRSKLTNSWSKSSNDLSVNGYNRSKLTNSRSASLDDLSVDGYSRSRSTNSRSKSSDDLSVDGYNRSRFINSRSKSLDDLSVDGYNRSRSTNSRSASLDDSSYENADNIRRNNRSRLTNSRSASLDDSSYENADNIRRNNRSRVGNQPKKLEETLPLSQLEVGDSAQSSGQKKGIPTPPPPPPMMGVGVPPPPPMMGGVGAAIVGYTDVGEYIQKYREYSDKYLDENGIKLFSRIINLHLKGNKQKILEGIFVGEGHSTRLKSELAKDLAELKKYASNNEDISSICKILGNLDKILSMLNRDNYGAVDSRLKTFRYVKNVAEGLAYEYFGITKNLPSGLQKAPYIKALKDTQARVEGAVVLAESFYDLSKLSMQENASFSESEMRDVISLCDLNRLISKKISIIDAREGEESEEIGEGFSKGQVIIPKEAYRIPTGKIVSERDFLERARDCINKTLEGDDQLDKLLGIKELLNNKYTTWESNESASKDKSKKGEDLDPMKMIRSLRESVLSYGKFLRQAYNDAEISSYSQSSAPFKSTGNNYNGGALIPSVINFKEIYRESNPVPLFERTDILKLIGNKRLNGDIVSEYINLISSSDNLNKDFMADLVRNIRKKTDKFDLSSFNFVVQQSAPKKEEKSLLELRVKGEKRERSFDAEDSIVLRSLINSSKEYVDSLESKVEDIEKMPDIMKKIGETLGTELVDRAGYVERVLDNLKFDNSSSVEEGRIVSYTGDKLSRDNDIPGIVFAFAQNLDLVKNSSAPIFPKSIKDVETDRNSIIEIATKLYKNLGKIIGALYNQNKNGDLNEFIQRIKNLRESVNQNANVNSQNTAN